MHFKVNQKIKFVSGPFEGQAGIIIGVPERKFRLVWIPKLGQTVITECYALSLPDVSRGGHVKIKSVRRHSAIIRKPK